MLKRLFISLIILSTLTSDNAANLYSDILNLCLGFSMVRSLHNATETVSEESGADEACAGLFSSTPFNNGVFVLSAESIKRLQIDNKRIHPSANSVMFMLSAGFIFSRVLLLFLFLLATALLLLFGKHRKIIAIQSDISPPLTIVI